MVRGNVLGYLLVGSNGVLDALCCQMMNIMTTSADMLVENLSSRCRGREGTVDMYSAFQSLSLDVIGRCAFGLQTRAQTDPHDEFLITIKSLFDLMSTTIILPLVSEYSYHSDSSHGEQLVRTVMFTVMLTIRIARRDYIVARCIMAIAL